MQYRKPTADSLERRRLRRDVLRWAKRFHYDPLVGDPDSIFEFMRRCLEGNPDTYSFEHAGEILRWAAEQAHAQAEREGALS
jgi:hypothetical protein